jgi:hypothetical protein
MTNPRVYRTLMAEIDDAIAAGRILSGPTDIISEAQAKELPYLQACIKEVGPCCRCFAPVCIRKPTPMLTPACLVVS